MPIKPANMKSSNQYFASIPLLRLKYGVVLRVISIYPNQWYCNKYRWAIDYLAVGDREGVTHRVYGGSPQEAEFNLANHAQKLCEYRED